LTADGEQFGLQRAACIGQRRVVRDILVGWRPFPDARRRGLDASIRDQNGSWS